MNPGNILKTLFLMKLELAPPRRMLSVSKNPLNPKKMATAYNPNRRKLSVGFPAIQSRCETNTIIAQNKRIRVILLFEKSDLTDIELHPLGYSNGNSNS
jgi:hypothetical protein